MIGDEKSYSFLIIFSAANFASESEAWSSGVTPLDIVFTDCSAELSNRGDSRTPVTVRLQTRRNPAITV
jgi:hypothetical protein